MSAPSVWLSRIRRSAAFACALTLAGLVAHNVALALKNQEELSDELKPRIKPRDIEMMTTLDHKPLIFARLSHFYYLEQRVAGKKLYVPPSYKREAWDFAHVARMKVIRSKKPQVIDPKKVKRLRKRIEIHRLWEQGELPNGRHKWKWLRIMVRKAAEEYVLAEGPKRREIFIIPRDVYLKNAMPASEVPPEFMTTDNSKSPDTQ